MNECYDRYIPDLIKGDLDSLREDVREYYSTKACFRGIAASSTILQCLGSVHLSRLGPRYHRSHEMYPNTRGERTQGRTQG